MKIISGSLKGRVLEGFNLEGTRPTMDRVKESLFAMIQNNIHNSTCLDLFSGSGNLGIEAISQGANKSYLADFNKKAIKVIRSNLNKFGISDKCVVIYGDFKKVLKEIDTKFDIIFLDPPYKTNYIEEAIKLISDNDLLNNNGLIICESDSLEKIIYSSEYSMIKDKKYGDKYVVILRKMWYYYINNKDCDNNEKNE